MLTHKYIRVDSIVIRGYNNLYIIYFSRAGLWNNINVFKFTHTNVISFWYTWSVTIFRNCTVFSTLFKHSFVQSYITLYLQIVRINSILLKYSLLSSRLLSIMSFIWYEVFCSHVISSFFLALKRLIRLFLLYLFFLDVLCSHTTIPNFRWFGLL